jgi:hypothetical protein
MEPAASKSERNFGGSHRDLKDFFVSTKDMDEAEKKKNLKILAEVALNSKRTGKNKK